MARADSTIRVNIIGDATSLTKAAEKAEGSVKGMNSQLLKVGGIVGGAFVTREIVDFGQTALNEADRVSDAAGRITAALGPEMAQALKDRADDFAKFGASEGDMLELEARFTDIATAAGIANDKLGPMAETAASTAAKLALITDTDADQWIDTLGKAVAKQDFRKLAELGIFLDEAAVNTQALLETGKDLPEQLTDGEKAAAAYSLIMLGLAPRLEDVSKGQGDLEQSTAELQAKMETLTGKIGEHLEGPLNDLATWVLDGISGYELLAQRLTETKVPLDLLTGSFRLLIAPLSVISDLLDAILGQLAQIPAGFGIGIGGFQTNNRVNINSPDSKVNINVQGGSPEAIEQAVRRAVLTTGRRG